MQEKLTIDEHIALCTAYGRTYDSAEDRCAAMARAIIPAVARAFDADLPSYDRIVCNGIKERPQTAKCFIRRGRRLLALNWLDREILCSIPEVW